MASGTGSKSKAGGERVRQFGVFLENKVGRLLELIRLFASHNIHILGISVLDTSDSAIVRIVVDDPDGAGQLMREQGIAFSECRLIVVELSSAAEDLKKVFVALLEAEVNVRFTYPLLTRPHGNAVLAIRCEDNDFATEVLSRHQFRLLHQEDLTR
jgi:hypothetical protein